MNLITPPFLFFKAKASGLYLQFGFTIWLHNFGFGSELDQNINNNIILAALSMPKENILPKQTQLTDLLYNYGSLSSNIKQEVGFDGNKMRLLEIKKRTILTFFDL